MLYDGLGRDWLVLGVEVRPRRGGQMGSGFGGQEAQQNVCPAACFLLGCILSAPSRSLSGKVPLPLLPFALPQSCPCIFNA